MTTDTQPGNTKKKRRGLLWKVPLGGLVLLLLTFAVFRFVVHQRVQNRLSAIRAAGYPVTLEELNEWYTYPDGPNAADVYQKAFEAYVKNKEIEQTLPIFNPDIKLPPPGEPLPEDLTKRIETYLADNAEAIALLEKAAKIEDCRFPIELTNGYDTLLPHLKELRHGAKLLILQSSLYLDQGVYDRVMDRCLTIYSIAASLEDEPVLISALVKVSLQALAYDEIERLINSGHISDEELQLLYRALKSNDPYRSIHRGMVGEMCFGNAFFAGSVQGPSSRELPSLWEISGVMGLDHAYYLDILTLYVDLTEAHTWSIPEMADDGGPMSSIYLVSGIIMPALEGSLLVSYKSDVKRYVLLIGIAAEQYRQKHGALPDQLNQLIPEFLDATPVDPFIGKPLRYRLEDGGAIIYSVGADETDNGGRWLDDDGDGNTYQDGTDITFTFGGLQEKLWPRRDNEDDQSE